MQKKKKGCAVKEIRGGEGGGLGQKHSHHAKRVSYREGHSIMRRRCSQRVRRKR